MISTDHKKVYASSWGFVALGAVGLSLTILIGLRNWSIQEAQARDQAKIQEQLQSARNDLNDIRLSQEYMKGQLNSLAWYLANMAGPGSSGSSRGGLKPRSEVETDRSEQKEKGKGRG